MRAIAVWCTGAALVLAACGGADGSDESGVAGDPPQISILDVSVGGGGAATLEYAFADDGPVRVQIDWGDGSALQGFTGEGGTFTSRHTYDAVVTSVVITVITTDADGNTSAATRTVDLVGSSSSRPVDTTPSSAMTDTTERTEPPTSTSSATTDAPASPTTTTTAPPAPPRPTTTASTTTTTTTTTTTSTTLPAPRRFRVVVQGDEITVVGDCDSIGGQGDFVIVGQFDAGNPESFSFGTRSNTVQLGDGATVDLSGEQSSSRAIDEGSTVDWSASFAVSEVDVGGDDPNMNGRTASDSGVISAPRDPQSRTISVGSGSCRVDMSFTVFAELQ
jgi:hypothetical protein